jgi:hypothetical protein
MNDASSKLLGLAGWLLVSFTAAAVGSMAAANAGGSARLRRDSHPLVADPRYRSVLLAGSPLAGALLLPYLLWVSFAGALTFAVWQRNPSLLA